MAVAVRSPQAEVARPVPGCAAGCAGVGGTDDAAGPGGDRAQPAVRALLDSPAGPPGDYNEATDQEGGGCTA